MLEIQQQLMSIKLVKNVKKKLKMSKKTSSQQRHLITAMLTLPELTLKKKMHQQTETIDAITNYCLFEKDDTCHLHQDKQSAVRAASSATITIKKNSEKKISSLTSSFLNIIILSVQNDKCS